ncbi:winged helix-turn-helix transcriptional regulator [Promicromonospora sp. Populi]|uniref:winged helix-turn-helix transcriptional regulator n=1 Tax=Promicromonospora sp. Populi TaxID=3239420 RepID=UPI0034E23776
MAQPARPRVAASRLEREILVLVSSGRAGSRKEIAESLGIAPSTVSQRVQAMLASGVLEETGEGASSGGRRPGHCGYPAAPATSVWSTWAASTPAWGSCGTAASSPPPRRWRSRWPTARSRC